MRRVVVDMQNALFSDAIATSLRHFDSSFLVSPSSRPFKTTYIFPFPLSNLLLMAFPSSTPLQLVERLQTRNVVQVQSPGCKLVLVVDENTEKKLADKVCQAKKDGLIDNFIYSSVSVTYLSAVIDVL